MSARAEPLVLRLPRRPGQKEERWVQLLTPETPALIDTHGGGATSADRATDLEDRPGAPARLVAAGMDPGVPIGEHEPPDRTSREPSALTDEVAALRAEVAALRAEVAALRAEVAALRAMAEQLLASLSP